MGNHSQHQIYWNWTTLRISKALVLRLPGLRLNTQWCACISSRNSVIDGLDTQHKSIKDCHHDMAQSDAKADSGSNQPLPHRNTTSNVEHLACADLTCQETKGKLHGHPSLSHMVQAQYARLCVQ